MRAPDATFDWVTARQACSAVGVFHKFRLMAQANVETRNAQLDTGHPGFGFEAEGERFAVFLKGRGARNAVDFYLGDPHGPITITHGDHVLLVRLTLDADGACRCQVNGDLLQVWQVMHLALEPLLFG